VVLSAPLVEAMGEVLASGDQVLLFLNKRGYAAAILCEMCGYIETVPELLGVFDPPSSSPGAGLSPVRPRGARAGHLPRLRQRRPLALGLGTERLESEVKARFPDARVARLDRTALKTKGALEQVLAQIHAREVDIVVAPRWSPRATTSPG